MPTPEPISISETLRALIGSNVRPVKRIAEDAGVDYQKLNRWFNHTTGVLDADMAEAVYKTLTGKTFTHAK